MSTVSPVSVGKTDLPLKSTVLHGPVPALAVAASEASPGVLLDGPPYANGVPHLGHVLNKHLKDAVARALALQGRAVAWRPGWDCHGLPLELAVEKQGVARTDRLAFLTAARAFADSQVQAQREVFEQQGWMAQWDRPWRTMDPGMEAGTLRVLADLVDAGLVTTGFRAVPWCPACQSTLAGAEQEEKTVQVDTWVAPFKVTDGVAGGPDAGDCLLSWTTTPWTLPLHQSLFVHPDATYVALTKEGAGRAWVGAEQASVWAQRLGATVSDATCSGAQLTGVAYRTPWAQGFEVRSDASVVPGAGTGVLHAVPGLSELDTQLGQAHGLPMVQWLTPAGRVDQSPCMEQRGLKAGPQASAAVLPEYVSHPWHLVLPQEQEVAHCWRHKAPLLTRASRQVFLRLTPEVRQRAETMVKGMAFTPEAGRTRLLAAMANRPDWCLSRQRTWGVPVALFLDRTTGQPHPQAGTWMRRVADEVAQRGVEAWWRGQAQDWVGNEADPAQLERVDDVLDVWFDSGCVPQLVGQADVVVEGTDQYRGWFQSCVWVAAALGRPAPFARVVGHGFVVDAHGEKLSKSSGGDAAAKPKGPAAPAWPTVSSDVVRLWALTGAEGADKSWSAATLQASQSLGARLRGLVRFMVANALPQTSTPPETLPAWDRYWWEQSLALADRVVDLAAQGRTGEAVASVLPVAESFSAACLGSWKDRLYCAPAHTAERQALDGVLKGCLEAWGRVVEVLMPRLRAEAVPYWPADAVWAFPGLLPAERQEVEAVLAMRAQLGPMAEALGREKVGPGLREVVGWSEAPRWPGQLLADALDVGLVVGPHEGRPVVRASSAAVCPRCRRAQPLWVGAICRPCHERVG